jgi:hypothetical protein
MIGCVRAPLVAAGLANEHAHHPRIDAQHLLDRLAWLPAHTIFRAVIASA